MAVTRYVLQVFEVERGGVDEPCSTLVEMKRFNSRWLRGAYMRAMRKRYGDDLTSKLWQSAAYEPRVRIPA